MRFLGWLLVVGFVGAYFWQLAAIGLGIVAVWGGVRLWGYLERLDAAERARIRALVRRADIQHRQVMRGDERGVYGIYPPARVA